MGHDSDAPNGVPPRRPQSLAPDVDFVLARAQASSARDGSQAVTLEHLMTALNALPGGPPPAMPAPGGAAPGAARLACKPQQLPAGSHCPPPRPAA